MNQGHSPIKFIRRLCAHKTEDEILEAEERFRQYLAIVRQICIRLDRERRGIDDPDHDPLLSA